MNPLTWNPYTIGLGVLLALTILGGTYMTGRSDGYHKAELLAEKQKSADNDAALKQYHAATQAQIAEDRAQALSDAAIIDKATAKMQVAARRFDALKFAQVPPGDCTIDAAWVRAYDDAR